MISLARRLSLAVALLACACATAPAGPAAKKATAADGAAVAAYVPLAVGNAWTYEVKTGGSAQLASDTVRIVGRDGPWFLDDHKGRMRLDGLGLRDSDRYLLRGPLAVGTGWSSVEQMAVQRFEITSIDTAVQTRAGLFENCVVVRNSQPLPSGTFVTEWTYAPDTGLISMRTKTISPAGKEQEQLRLSLVKFERATP